MGMCVRLGIPKDPLPIPNYKSLYPEFGGLDYFENVSILYIKTSMSNRPSLPVGVIPFSSSPWADVLCSAPVYTQRVPVFGIRRSPHFSEQRSVRIGVGWLA